LGDVLFRSFVHERANKLKTAADIAIILRFICNQFFVLMMIKNLS
jgi:hypothetical protein